VLRAFVTRFLPLTRNKNMYLRIVKTHNERIKDLISQVYKSFAVDASFIIVQNVT